MKKIICLLLSLLLMMAVLTSCDLRAGIAELENLYFEMVGALLETSPESNEQTTPHPGVTNPEPEATTPGQEITPDEPKHLFTDFSKEDKERIQALVGLVIPFIPNNEYYVEEYEDETGPYISFYTFGNTQAEFDAYRELFTDYTYDGSEVDEYGDTWYYYSIGDIYVDMSFYLYEDEYVVSIFIYPMDESGEGENNPGESEIDYGTLTNPVSTSYAYDMCAYLADGESSLSPFYINGTVTAIGEVGKYYKNVYFTDGETEMLIYTINMGDGISSFAVGDTIVAYGYVKNYQGTIEMATYNGSVYVYVVKVETENNDSENTDTSNHTYTSFTDDEKARFRDAVGLIIPFIPNDEYYIEEYETWNNSGLFFYTLGNTQEEFDAYLTLFDSYTYEGVTVNDYGDTWYLYSIGDVLIDTSYYVFEGIAYVDVYVYIVTDDWTEEEWDDPEIELLPNDGKGLPEDADGIYDVDFTKGEYIQNVSGQQDFMDGCPTTGSPAVLVIPVEFSDATAQSKGYTIDKIEQICYGNDLLYYSLHEYFLISSHNQLDLDITILDTWFRPANDSSYYKEMTANHANKEEQEMGSQLIIDEALAYLATFMDLSKFDSDNNGYIDAIVLVNTLEIDDSHDFHWAYQYQNWYKDENGSYYKYDGVSANHFAWISYGFMFEAYDEEGYLFFDQSNPLNPYTFIHEFSHILGAHDYYDTMWESQPLGGADVMDTCTGDHNPYTKFNYGWITTSKLIVTDSTLTVNLEAFSKSNDTVLIATNWDDTLGAYQEYYIVMYYTITGLNDSNERYFDENAILVYHINATLKVKREDGKIHYAVYNNNTSVGTDSTRNNLIEYVISGDDDYIYTVGETLPTTTDDAGNELGYTFTVDVLTEEYATITFTKK